MTDGECLSPENTSPYVSGSASPVESHHQQHHHQHQQQCYDLPPMTAMNMTVQQQPGESGGSHYSSNSPVSYPGSVSPIISQPGLNNNDFGAFSAYYAANGSGSQQQHYYTNVIQQQQHSPDNEEQQQSLLTSS